MTKPICFNCGDNHFVKDCPKARDEKRIAQNRKTFNNKKTKIFKKKGQDEGHGQGGGKKKKWSPPTTEEKAAGNTREINGATHVYNHKTRRWNKKRMAETTEDPGSDTPPASNSSMTAGTSMVEDANKRKQLATVLQGLADSFK